MANSNNKLLASLSTNDFDLLEPHLESIDLRLRKSSKSRTNVSAPRIFLRAASHLSSQFNVASKSKSE
jgi:hypothetical protein